MPIYIDLPFAVAFKALEPLKSSTESVESSPAEFMLLSTPTKPYTPSSKSMLTSPVSSCAAACVSSCAVSACCVVSTCAVSSVESLLVAVSLLDLPQALRVITIEAASIRAMIFFFLTFYILLFTIKVPDGGYVDCMLACKDT